MSSLQQVDPEVAAAIRSEERRQADTIELIASENYASAAVLEAQGSVLTNKYAEGLPAKRYYGGCEFVDQTEQLAIDRVKRIFQAEHANVQPHSGAQANMAAYFAFLTFGDTIMGMNLSHGGHLTHGSPVNFSGKFYNVVPYGVSKETEQIDYDEVARIAGECRPKMIVTGASAYPRTIDFARFREIADSVGALLLADMAHIAGLVAVGLHPSPVPYCHVVTSTTHKTLRGPRGGFILCPAEHAALIDKAVFPLIQGGPLEHVIAAKAVAFGEALRPDFVAYQGQVVGNARVLAEALQQEGLRVVSGGTDNHLMLVDVTVMGLTGRQVEKALDAVGITVNKNAIPFDPHPPMRAGGIRLGTPASTTRGFGTDEMWQIARWIGQVVKKLEDKDLQARIRAEVLELCGRFPVPGIPSRAGV